MRYQAILLPLLLAISGSIAATKVACVGNSITNGYNLDWSKTYPQVLQNLLGEDFSVANYGVSGTTVLKEGNNPYWNQDQFTLARSSNPDIVVIELGTNDVKIANWYRLPTQFPLDYAALIDTFQVLDSKPEIWASLASYANNPDWGMYDTSITLRINPDILKVALDQGVNIIDLHSEFDDPAWLQQDSVHPNAEGAAALANIVYNHLSSIPGTIGQNLMRLTAPDGYAWQWYLDGSPIENATAQTLDIANVGEYRVLVKVRENSESRHLSKPLVVTDLGGTSPGSSTATLAMQRCHIQAELRGNTLQINAQRATTLRIRSYAMDGSLQEASAMAVPTGNSSVQIKPTRSLEILRIEADGAERHFMRHPEY